MDEETRPAAYRIHVWIRRINPMIWRRDPRQLNLPRIDSRFLLPGGDSWPAGYLLTGGGRHFDHLYGKWIAGVLAVRPAPHSGSRRRG
jgi:hypothetical protein